MPRQWKGRTFYSKAEMAEMTPERREKVRQAHRPHAFVRPEELPAAYRERTRAEMAAEVAAEERNHGREAS